MKQLPPVRLLLLGITLAAAAILVAAAEARTSARPAAGGLVSLRKTALGTILVDSRGRTLYLFEKDRNDVSMCNTACLSYWPALTSRGAPRAGTGVRRSLLGLTRAQSGVRQVTYAGHPLYTFVGDKRAGETTGENLDNFGAEWYAVAASGRKVEPGKSSVTSSGSSGGYGSGGGLSPGALRP